MKSPQGQEHDLLRGKSPAGKATEALDRQDDSGAFRQLAETLPELLWTCQPDGKCDYFNAQWTRFTGRQLPELLGDQWRDCLHPEDREDTCSYWLSALKGDVPYDLEYRLRRRDGPYHWFKVRAAPLRDDRHKIVKWFGICTDIQDLKDTEKNLRASDDWLRTLMETTKDFAIFSVNPQNVVTEWNAGAEHLFGYDAREIIGRNAEVLFLPEEREAGVPEAELATARAHGVAMNERWHLRRGVERFFASGAVRPIYDQRGELKGYLKVARDLTLRKEMEQRLEAEVIERTNRVREMMREMESFSYSVSHDLRSPLRAISGFAHLALARSDHQLTPELKDFLTRIVANTERAEALINDVLEYSRVVRAEVPLTSIDLEPLVRSIVASDPAFEFAQAQIHVRPPLHQVVANRSALAQSISNLLSNALKFVRRETVPDIQIWAELKDARVRLWVEDNGIGIAASDLHRIFSPFQRGEGARDFEGTGIGLAIVRKAMERMNGNVGVLSEPGKGSRFWLELPSPKSLR